MLANEEPMPVLLQLVSQIPIGRFGSTDASVSLVSITVGITVEHP